MPEIHTEYLKLALIQLLREKEMIEKEGRFHKRTLDPSEKQKFLNSINMELSVMLQLYTERTGKTLEDFLEETKTAILKSKEPDRLRYI